MYHKKNIEQKNAEFNTNKNFERINDSTELKKTIRKKRLDDILLSKRQNIMKNYEKEKYINYTFTLFDSFFTTYDEIVDNISSKNELTFSKCIFSLRKLVSSESELDERFINTNFANILFNLISRKLSNIQNYELMWSIIGLSHLSEEFSFFCCDSNNLKIFSEYILQLEDEILIAQSLKALSNFTYDCNMQIKLLIKEQRHFFSYLIGLLKKESVDIIRNLILFLNNLNKFKFFDESTVFTVIQLNLFVENKIHVEDLKVELIGLYTRLLKHNEAIELVCLNSNVIKLMINNAESNNQYLENNCLICLVNLLCSQHIALIISLGIFELIRSKLERKDKKIFLLTLKIITNISIGTINEIELLYNSRILDRVFLKFNDFLNTKDDNLEILHEFYYIICFSLIGASNSIKMQMIEGSIINLFKVLTIGTEICFSDTVLFKNILDTILMICNADTNKFYFRKFYDYGLEEKLSTLQSDESIDDEKFNLIESFFQKQEFSEMIMD